MDLQFADLACGRLSYLDLGRGSPLLLASGGVGTVVQQFSRQLDVFARDHRVIAPDRLGHGASGPRPGFGPHPYGEGADELFQLLDCLQPGPVHLLGFSVGAVIARHLTVDHPDLVRSLILVNGPRHVDPQVIARVWSNLPLDAIPPSLERSYARSHGPERWRAFLGDMKRADEAEAASGGDPSDSRLDEIRCPVLVLYGDQDTYVAEEHALALVRDIPGARLVPFPGYGHFLPTEAPEEFARVVLEFIHDVDRDVDRASDLSKALVRSGQPTV